MPLRRFVCFLPLHLQKNVLFSDCAVADAQLHVDPRSIPSLHIDYNITNGIDQDIKDMNENIENITDSNALTPQGS